MAKSKKGKKAAEPVVEPEPEPEFESDLRIIYITVTGYKNIIPLFSATDINVNAKYLDLEIGDSEKIPVTDDEVLMTSSEFIIECDINSPKEIDRLISNPVLFTVTLSPGSSDPSVYTPVKNTVEVPLVGQGLLSVDSAELLANAFIEEPPKPPSKASKGKKGSKTSKGSELSKGSSKDKNKEKTSANQERERELPNEPVVIGTCLLDLIQLFLGNEGIQESLPIVPNETFYDDRMLTSKTIPQLLVNVSLDSQWRFGQNKNPNIINFTVESLYNVPSLMMPDMTYRTCTLLPNITGKDEPVVFYHGKYTQEKNLDQLKRWPSMSKQHNLTAATKYKVDPETHTIRNQANVEIATVLESENPRIEWNLIKRNLLPEQALHTFHNRIKKYRHIALEIFMIPDTESEENEAAAGKGGGKGKDKGGKKSDKSSKSSKGGKGAKKDAGDNFPEYLHLMALINVSSLLYPGVRKVRVACPLKTFQSVEALEASGLDDSYFLPQKKEEVPPSSKGKGSSKKSDKGSKKGSKKGSRKGGGGGEPVDLKYALPLPPEPPEPSTPVINENGDPSFIIVEIELLSPLAEKRTIEDLSEQLEYLVPKKPEVPKHLISSRMANIYYQEIIRKLLIDINHQYLNYAEDVKKCRCVGHHADFLTYLRRSGIYQTYLNTMTKAASVIVNDKFEYSGKCNKASHEYQNFISEVFSFLVTEMNYVFNGVVTSALEPPPLGSLAALDSLLLYAKESTELCADGLANRYYLERLSRDERNPDYWFDYAVFLLEVGKFDKGFECVHEALTINLEHKYSLLLYAILLADKGKVVEAETCFLKVLTLEPKWVEGWATFFLFYKDRNNLEGAEYAQEMAMKYLNDHRAPRDYFISTDNLAWSCSICPNTMYMRAATMLIKMRVFEYAEKALSCDLIKNAGVAHYLFGVIDYYKGNYDSALIHLEQAEHLYGPDYSVCSLIGHVFLSMGNTEKAKIYYTYVTECFNRPEDIHLVYVNFAIVWDFLENKNESRKLLLLACKHSPTPYTWLAVGLLYYQQRDLLSAEECLTQANICDNRLPEIWAYLTLINIQLGRYSEAEMCYRQTLKNNLDNKELFQKVNDAMKVKNIQTQT